MEIDNKMKNEMKLYQDDDKSTCDVCGRVFPYKEVYWWLGLQICADCYPQTTGLPVPEYWR